MSAFHLPRQFRLQSSPPEFAYAAAKNLLGQPSGRSFGEGFAQASGPSKLRYAHSSAATNRSQPAKRRRTNSSAPFLKPQGQVRGILSSTDSIDPYFQGTYYVDDYRLKGLTAGQQIEVRLNSRQFDPYLQLVNGRTKQPILYGSDLGGTNTNARVVFTVQPQTQYLVRVSSDQRRQIGSYLVKSRVLKPIASHFNLFYGYGLVDAAAAINRVTGQTLFKPAADVPVLGGNQWGLDLVRVPEVWTQGFTGQGVTVAVLDEGIDLNHPDLSRNLWRNSDEIPGNGIDDDRNGFIDDVHGWNFIDQNPNLNDTEGHGTQVAGIIAAANDGIGITGVAHNAKIMPIKVIQGETPLAQFDANVAAGIDYAANNGAQVINISLGSSSSDPPLPKVEAALRRARQAGVVVVFSAGNDRQLLSALEPDRPALYASAGLGIAVGGVDNKRNFYIDSNPAGLKRLNYVVAPAVDVYSTTLGSSYDLLEGTSFAAPFVAGVAALLLSAKPDLPPAEVEAALLSSASQQIQLAL
ncbi:S8 family serine peptidase [Leptolyngbya sp. NK1-12]|uniref:S8 family serine peptidase n=1 Tax=Leptolyngbya sp. NK1-12 TaxID=2547451 RepID=A0AA97AJD0_9CYAN|nr:S8 family peptidase [Leptolyngbya sp. NK1-12]WNZ22637.1 S8 family serine peptidase [Leptolyngbya sp. NK1-12]